MMKNLFSLLFIIALFPSCKKDTPETNQTFPPSITSISPTSGNPETDVTINGSNFSTVLNENVVKFNGSNAKVISASSTTLIVKVPIGAGTGPVSLTTSQGTAAGPSFTYMPDIFIGGIESNGTHSLIKYWKNGTSVPVTSGSTDASAYSMALSGSDVYLAGRENSSSGISVAKYWKNGNAVLLTNGMYNAGTFSIVIAGSDIYVAGYETTSNGVSVAKYWKNGIATALTDGTHHANAYSIVVSGTDIFVAGYEAASNGVFAAKYWKNGIATPITNLPNVETQAMSIAVNGSDIHIVIYEFDVTTTVYKYWKNGITSDITGATQVDQIILVSNDIFMVGRQSKTAVYWKNGIANSLTDGSNSAVAHAVTVYGNDVYVAGNEFNGTIKVGKYWKNGQATNFTNGSLDTSPWGIIVR